MLEDLKLLRDELGQLRQHTDQTALFATALFDLERARRGDPDARMQLLEVADSLLVFWRERTGDALADTHPALGPLWAHASALLVSFEIKRFKRALDACWEARGDAALLQVAIDGLQPPGNRRVEFAACLYHLELARLFVDSSRGQFARRAGLIHEAYHSKEAAAELVGDDPGLQHLWKDLVPYLDEFFEALEAEQERKLRSNVATEPGGAAAVARSPVPPPPEITPVHGVKPAAPLPAAESTAGETTDPIARPVAEEVAVTFSEPAGEQGSAPDVEPEAEPIAVTFVGRTPQPVARPAAEVEAEPIGVTFVGRAPEPIEEVQAEAIRVPEPVADPVTELEPEAIAMTFVGPTPVRKSGNLETDPTDPSSQPLSAEAIVAAPPPPPADSTGVFDLWLKEPNRPTAPPPPRDLTPTPAVIEAVEEYLEPVPTGPPPPPANFTPAPGSMLAMEFPDPDVTAPRPPPPPNTTPAPGRAPMLSQSGILDLQDIVEEVPSLPPQLRRSSLDVEMGDYEPDEATQTFWRHTEETLGLLPAADAPRMDRRALSADGRTERKKLNGWLDGVTRRFNTVPEARTFACLTKLYMAAQLKEKGLFGGANAKRKEAFVAALELLSAEPVAAGHCAVWFELDGKETLEHLGNGLEVLTDYLQFCARQNLDPLDPAVPAQFMA
ncbi:MAG: hypothetical protein H6Q89_1700 [Myxococcaceae bacterium]|nr:hypothetical protein [Myxococcaceae bacterium]